MSGRTRPRSYKPKSDAGTNVSFRIASFSDMICFSRTQPGEAHDLPGGAKRRKQLAQGIEWTVVNGQVLMERGEHTGAYPGKVARSSRPAQQ
jgi:hypothetical protein